MKLTPTIILLMVTAGLAYLIYPSDKGKQPARESVHIQPAAAAPYLGPSLAVPTPAQYAPVQSTGPSVFALGPNGELIVDAGTASRLDVLLAQLPERPSSEDLRPLEDNAKKGLPDAAARDAVRIVHAYIDYRKSEAEFEAQPRKPNQATAEATLDQIIALRRAYLGAPVADALFAASEAQSRFSIQSTRINADSNLSAQEKSARIDALRKTMPQGVVPEEDHDPALMALRTTEQQVAMRRERGASEAEIMQLRQQTRGTEDAQFIADMEAQKFEWERRYQAFSQQKIAILNSGMSAQDKQANIEALLRRHYKEEEIQTARAYDLEFGRK